MGAISCRRGQLTTQAACAESLLDTSELVVNAKDRDTHLYFVVFYVVSDSS